MCLTGLQFTSIDLAESNMLKVLKSNFVDDSINSWNLSFDCSLQSHDIFSCIFQKKIQMVRLGLGTFMSWNITTAPVVYLASAYVGVFGLGLIRQVDIIFE